MGKTILAIIAIVHGAIHILGLLKAYKPDKVPQLKQAISKPVGLFWFLAFLLLLFSGFRIGIGVMCWYPVAIFAVLISSTLIIMSWRDAKWGMIPNIIIAVAAYMSFAHCSFEQQIDNEIKSIMTLDTKDAKVITNRDLESVPEIIQNWLKESGVVGKPDIHNLYVKQSVELKLTPVQAEWYSASSEQFCAVKEPAFVWTLDMKMASVLPIRGRDKIIGGKGEMRIRAFGAIDIVNQTGKQLDEGAMQRYLGEMVWYPTAALEPYISWKVINKRTARATMSYEGIEVSGDFEFNENNMPIKFSCMRYMGDTKDGERMPWIVEIQEYRVFDGVRVPSAMEATWKLEEDDWTWMKMTIENINYNPKAILMEMGISN